MLSWAKRNPPRHTPQFIPFWIKELSKLDDETLAVQLGSNRLKKLATLAEKIETNAIARQKRYDKEMQPEREKIAENQKQIDELKTRLSKETRPSAILDLKAELNTQIRKRDEIHRLADEKIKKLEVN
jgi:hypothetical protein